MSDDENVVFTNFKNAFENCLLNRTGIVLNNGPCHQEEMSRDLERALRLSGLAGDDSAGVDIGKDAEGQGDWSDEALELMSMVEKLGPLNPNLASEAFIKPFFKHLNLSQFNIEGVDEDLLKFTNLTFLDLSRNALSAVDYLPPNLKFFKGYNNAVQAFKGCKKSASLVFLGAGYNRLGTVGFEQISNRFRNLLSLDLSYNDLTELRNFTSDAQSLQKLRHLTLVGNPFCLLPYYRLVVIKHLKDLQILDDVQVWEAEVTDAQLVNATNTERPQEINLGVSFSVIKTFKNLLKPLAKELPDKKMEGEEEVPISVEDRIAEVCRSGDLSFSIELPDGRWVKTTPVPLSDPENAEQLPEEIDLSGIKVQGEEKTEPLFFVWPLNAPSTDAPTKQNLKSGSKEIAAKETAAKETDALIVLRDWLRGGMKVKAFFQKSPPPVEEPAEGEEAPPPPILDPPRPIGGCVVPLNSVLRPSVCTIPEEARQEKALPVPPAPTNLGPATVNLAPYSKWIEPDVQVPLCEMATKNVSEDSAIFKIGISLYAPVPPPEADEAAA